MREVILKIIVGYTGVPGPGLQMMYDRIKAGHHRLADFQIVMDIAGSQLPKAGIFTKMLLRTLFSAPGLFVITFVLSLAFPFDLEKYLKYHYQKTRDQTLSLMGTFAQDGEARGLLVENIRILLQGLLDAG